MKMVGLFSFEYFFTPHTYTTNYTTWIKSAVRLCTTELHHRLTPRNNLGFLRRLATIERGTDGTQRIEQA